MTTFIFIYNPHEYQDYAKEFIIGHPVSLLLLDMGLGKTVITLTDLWELLLDYFEVRRILVIAPLRVARDTWLGEYEKWDHLNGMMLSLIIGSEKERKPSLNRKANVYVINRENVEWLVGQGNWDFDMIIIDELSSFKSHKAKRFKALRKVRAKAHWIVGLTGTPTPNGAVYDENGDVRHIHNRKLDALEDLLEAANGKPVLVAYWYKHDKQRIQERFHADLVRSDLVVGTVSADEGQTLETGTKRNGGDSSSDSERHHR